MHRAEQAFLILVFAVSLYFVFLAFNAKPEGYESIMLAGAIMAAGAMICWFLGGKFRRPPGAG